MATTTNLGLVLIDVGQKEKEAAINNAFTSIDTQVATKTFVTARYIGERTSDPATAGLVAGATYYNSSTNKLKVLLSTLAWANAA